MCVAPSFFWLQVGNGYEKIPKGCNDCWRCRQNAVNDWTGRGLCEAATSDWSLTLTLTYAPRWDGAEKHCQKSHFQDFIRSLRKRGHSIRYLVVAEKSEKNTQRVHFHCILWGRGEYPCGFYSTVEAHRNSLLLGNAANDPFICKDRWPGDKRRIWLPSWPHGHVVCDQGASAKSIRYVVKYLKKDDEKQWFSMSKKPLIGADWIIAKAKTYADYGVQPSSFEYSPPFGKPGHRYLLTGKSRQLLIKTIYEHQIEAALALLCPPTRNQFVHKAYWSVQKDLWSKHVEKSPQTLLQDEIDINEHPFLLNMRNIIDKRRISAAKLAQLDWEMSDAFADECNDIIQKKWGHLHDSFKLTQIGRRTVWTPVQRVTRAPVVAYSSSDNNSAATRRISEDIGYAAKRLADAGTPGTGCCCSCCVARRKSAGKGALQDA